MPTRRRRQIIAVIVMVLAIPCLIFVYWAWRRGILSYVTPPCLYQALFNIYCPGCGITRMVLQLLSGDIVAAFTYNPLCFIAVLPTVLLTLDYLVRLFTPYHLLPPIEWPESWLWGLLAVVLLYGVLRNLTIPPFSYLAPGALLSVLRP